jgi:hypothetical protein
MALLQACIGPTTFEICTYQNKLKVQNVNQGGETQTKCMGLAASMQDMEFTVWWRCTF